MRATYLCMYHAPSCKASLHCSRTHSFPMCFCICILCIDMQSFPCIHQYLSQHVSYQHRKGSARSPMIYDMAKQRKAILKCITAEAVEDRQALLERLMGLGKCLLPSHLCLPSPLNPSGHLQPSSCILQTPEPKYQIL